MSLPTVQVHLDLLAPRGGGFTLDDPVLSRLDFGNVLDFAVPTYSEDISPYLRSFSSDRGASSELEAVENGTCNVVLDNRDGRFSPNNTGSPYSPNILPMRRIRIQAIWNAVTYPVYMGYVEEWPYTFPGDKDSIVTVQLVDGFDLLGADGIAVSGSFPQQGSGARVGAILDAAGWPPTERTIDTGVATVPAITLDNIRPLEHIRQIEFAEQGRFFIGRDGKAVFRGRTGTTAIAATWADDGSGLSYRETITPRLGRSNIRNDIRLTRTGGIEQISADTTSQHEFGTRSLVRSDVQLVTDGAVLVLADFIRDKFAFPSLRIEGIDDLAMAHDQWDQVLPLEINDAVNVKESRLALSQVSRIQRRHDEYDGESYAIGFQVAPTTIENYARLDDSNFKLDDNFILGR